MHVLLLPSWYPTAARAAHGRFFATQAAALVDAGHRVGVLDIDMCGWSAWPRRGRMMRAARQAASGTAPVVLHARPLAWVPRSQRISAELWLRAGVRLAERYVREHGMPDVVHAHAAILGGALAARLVDHFGRRGVRLPVVLTEHRSAYALERLPVWKMHCTRTALRAAHVRLVVSAALGERLDALVGAAAAPWRVVPNMLPPEHESDPRLAGVGPDESTASCFVFITVGALQPHKGHAVVFEALARARAQQPEVARRWRLRVVGAGALRGELEAQASTLGVGDAVEFLGALPPRAMADALRGAHAFVMASVYETFGVAVIEALAAGLPVVATACGGPDAVVRPRDGVLVPVGDVAAFAAAMLQMVAERRRYDAAAIRAGALERFGAAAVLRALERAYADALVEARGRGSVTGGGPGVARETR